MYFLVFVLIKKSFADCSHSPCQNNGTCLDVPALKDYLCLCQDGWVGHNCQIHISMSTRSFSVASYILDCYKPSQQVAGLLLEDDHIILAPLTIHHIFVLSLSPISHNLQLAHVPRKFQGYLHTLWWQIEIVQTRNFTVETAEMCF